MKEYASMSIRGSMRYYGTVDFSNHVRVGRTCGLDTLLSEGWVVVSTAIRPGCSDLSENTLIFLLERETEVRHEVD